MKIGGYQIVDLKNVNHELSVGMVHEGIYDIIESTRKPILLSGIHIDDKEFHDSYANFSVSGTNFVATVYGYTITIEDTDVVTITQ